MSSVTHAGQRLDRMPVSANHIDTLRAHGYRHVLKINQRTYAQLIQQGTLAALAHADAVYFPAWGADLTHTAPSFCKLWRLLTQHGFAVCCLPAGERIVAVAGNYTPRRSEDLAAVRFLNAPHRPMSIVFENNSSLQAYEWMNLL